MAKKFYPHNISPFRSFRHQETIVTVVAESYLALDPTAAAAKAGAEALAGAVTAYGVRMGQHIAYGVKHFDNAG